MHGSGGDETAWLELGRTAQILDNLIAAGKCKPMIVVMTNGHVENKAAPGIDGPLTLVEAGITDFEEPEAEAEETEGQDDIFDNFDENSLFDDFDESTMLFTDSYTFSLE